MQKRLTYLPSCENTKILLIQMLDTALNFAVRVASGELSNTDEMAESVFRLLFNLLKTYKKSAEPDNFSVRQTTKE